MIIISLIIQKYTQRQYDPLLISQMSQSGWNNAVIITAEDILGNLWVIIPSPSQPLVVGPVRHDNYG